MNQKLTTSDHSRDIAGLKYVYPVLSRRAGGLSVGINFNTNNACNWRCIYCQVPDLVRGAAPEMNFQLLEWELRFFLQQVLMGDFYDQFNVPEQQRIIKDIAISGNGEPTSLKQFDKAMALIGQIATEMGVLPESHFVLITNGSLMHKSVVEEGLKILDHFQGEVWFKLDSATESGKMKINDSKQTDEKTLENLKLSSALCNTSLQTCIVDFLAAKEAVFEQKKYVELLAEIKRRQIKIQKIMLYTIARPSLQPEAKQINKVDENIMEQYANQLRSLEYKVKISL
ncbi:MAG: radical SAM protein [Methylococcaceae bacterium]|nr:radical SAM protein [Methylococcaceae bacterium]